jgi:ribonuclease D
MKQIITTTTALAEFCERLSAEPFVTLDTEFIREKTYWPQLCLIQMAGAQEAWAIDPLAEGMDLSPLYALLANPKVLKVLHAARQDMEIFFLAMGKTLPQPIFDTQVAAQVAGLGESVGYEALVKQLLGKSLDKSQRFTDWARRPLTEAQIDYALGDVIYLHEAYRKLVARIEKHGRMGWIAEEMQELHNPALYLIEPDMAWERIRLRASHPRQLGRLKLLAAWREMLAQREDIPRIRIIRDETLVELATNLPATEAEMEAVRGFPQHLKRGWRQELWQVIETARNLPKESWPPLPKHDPLPAQAEGRLEILKLLLKQCARDADVTPRLIADKDGLELLARNKLDPEKDAAHPLMHGWRWEVFGNAAYQMLQGKMAIRLHPVTGAVVIEAL